MYPLSDVRPIVQDSKKSRHLGEGLKCILEIPKGGWGGSLGVAIEFKSASAGSLRLLGPGAGAHDLPKLASLILHS